MIDIDEQNDRRTITLDLTQCDAAPSQVFDCIICTQTLFEIYDYTAAVRSLFKMLREGGVLLATFPGISQSVRGGMLGGAGSDWWRFTAFRQLDCSVTPSARAMSGSKPTAMFFLLWHFFMVWFRPNSPRRTRISRP